MFSEETAEKSDDQTEEPISSDQEAQSAAEDDFPDRRKRSPAADAFDSGASYFSKFFNILDPGNRKGHSFMMRTIFFRRRL